LTARQREPREDAQLHSYEVINLTRQAVPRLATESLVRIHDLSERALAGQEPTDAVTAEPARTLDPDV
jgi:hypothetical protein